MEARSKATTIDEYLADFSGVQRERLDEMRAIIRAAAPADAVETISYSIPTIDLRKRHLVHFAGFANHIGFYPTGEGAAAFAEELSVYPTGKGSVRLPLDAPLPAELITRIVRHRVERVLRGAR